MLFLFIPKQTGKKTNKKNNLGYAGMLSSGFLNVLIFSSVHMVVHMTQMLLAVGRDDEWLQKPQLACRCLM